MDKERRAFEQHYGKFLLRKKLFIVILAAAVILTAALSAAIGSMRIPLSEVFVSIFGAGSAKYKTVLMNVRLPRTVTAIVCGAILASAGAVMQCVLRNPLASASTLGVSQGAAFGAALGIIVFGGGVMTASSSSTLVTVNSPYIVTLCAFVFGSLSSLVIIGISRLKQGAGPAGLVLAGSALSAMFSGGSALLQYFADDTALGAVVFWTFGNLGSTGWKEILFLLAVMLLTGGFYIFNAWNYNAMTAGVDTANSLGVNAQALMLSSMAVCSLAAAAAVSFVGIIGFVGLIAPHMVRRFTGSDFRFLLPGSALAGSLLLLLSDIACRTIISPVVLPIGAILSFVGGPVFLILLFKGDKANA